MDNKCEVLWDLKDISKYFTGVKALDNLSLKIKTGEIHGLMGENGCGKSTLIKCISGVHQQDEGIIYYKGKPVSLNSPTAARNHGVATIFQEFSLVPTLSVAENIFLNRLPGKGGTKGFVNWQDMNEKAKGILQQLDIEINPERIVNTLSVAQQQLVEIAKALSMDASLLIMDEPTAALGLSEIKKLHQLVRKLRDKGYAIIYISHRMDEVVELVDCVTVMKDGKIVGECCRDEIAVDKIVRFMIGNDISDHYPKEVNVKQDVIFDANNLFTENGVNGATFDIKRGEIFGLAGLIGSGRTEIAKAIFGVDRLIEGNINLYNKNLLNIKRVKSPKEAIRNGMAFITENRKYDGLFMNFFAGENITIVKLKKIIKSIFLRLNDEGKVGKSFIEKLRITPLALEKSVQFLSGGNQQKVIIARWIYSEADIFIMDEPTQGIDVNAKVEVYNLMNELTRQGKSILFISSDFPELLAMSDRIGIVDNGNIEKIIDRSELDRAKLMQLVLAKQNI